VFNDTGLTTQKKRFFVRDIIVLGFEDGAWHSGSLGFWALSIVWYSKKHSVSVAGSVSVLIRWVVKKNI
jgi:hypothetical protein